MKDTGQRQRMQINHPLIPVNIYLNQTLSSSY